jgi:hypothetical protein
MAALNVAKIADGPIINACFPRSGHRFLREILSHYFGPELVFYESHQDAIVAADSAQRRLERVNYVKTHDFSLEGRAVLRDSFPGRRRYLVQIRHPLESIASYYEFWLRSHAVIFDNRLTWWIFLYAKLQYWKAFFDLWLRDLQTDQLLVEYDALYRNPETTAVRVIRFLTEADEVDESRLSNVVRRPEFVQYVRDPSSRRAGRRDLRDFKYFDARRFASIERSLAEHYLRPAGVPLLFEGR